MAKVIAVFADGTGNSAAKLFKTNVWRLYDALDTSDPGNSGLQRQIAYYHDGVGTSSFKPMAIAGGAFGWGLKRNVLDLYTFVCRNYQPGDRICAFGFSRGAFTVRLLAGLIAREGLVVNTSERDLEAYARDAYRQYRRRFNQTKGLVGPLRNLRDLVLAGWRKLARRHTYKERTRALPNHDVEIDFLGVWDTVAAYGMPIAEITRGIDDWVWPLSMPNYKLSPKVKRACHALSLDDERDTFHPLIWDEESETDPDRIKQVWFAGMHSDVGGGYPDDSLAYVSLYWMLTEAAGANLRFQIDVVNNIKRIMSANGALHDSRRGIGAYYRYQPRKIGAHVSKPDPTTLLMQDPEPETSATLVSVKIHDSVFRRIQQGTDRYAPIVLPDSYVIASTGGGPSLPVESSPRDRAEKQERVWDRVWKRRVTYFLTVGFSAYLLLLPLWNQFWPPSACVGPQCLFAPVIHAAGGLIPAVAQPWVDALAAAPGRSALVMVIIALLIGRSRKLQTESRDDMRALWEGALGLSPVTKAPPRASRRIRQLRQHPAYQHFFQSLKWKVLPVVFGWLALAVSAVVVLALPAMTVLRVGIWKAESSNVWCEPAKPEFETSSKCWPLPITAINAGTRYRITVTLDAKHPWRDLSIDTTPEGFGLARMGLPGNLFAPLRRSLSAQWFQPLVKIVTAEGGFAIVPLEMQRADTSPSSYTAQFIAPKSGRAYFFVNDVLLPPWVPNAERFYQNNRGTATIGIEPVGD